MAFSDQAGVVKNQDFVHQGATLVAVVDDEHIYALVHADNLEVQFRCAA